MPPLDRIGRGRFLTLALLTLIGAASPVRAGAIYSITDLGLAGANVDIFNSSGQITAGSIPGRLQDGSYFIETRPGPEPSGAYRAYLGIVGQQPTELNTVPLPGGGDEVFANAVNKSGTVVGAQGQVNDIGAPYVYTQAAGMQLVPVPYPRSNPTNSFGTAFSINDAGLIVGTASGPIGIPFNPMVAFLSNGQQSWDLNTLVAPGSGLLLTSASDINDAGQILSMAVDSQGREHNVLLTPLATPAPEPASWLVMATGGLALGCRRLVRRAGPGGTGSPLPVPSSDGPGALVEDYQCHPAGSSGV